MQLDAKEVFHVGRSPRALIMGDAFAALADDEYTLFYNPAALGKEADLRVVPFNPHLGILNPLDYIDKFQNMPSGVEQIAEVGMGIPLYFSIGAFPTLKFGPIGISMYAQRQGRYYIDNPKYPQLTIDDRLDRGFVIGMSHRMEGFGKDEFSFGFSFKSVKRAGIFGTFDMLGGLLLDVLNSGSISPSSLKEILGYSKGSGKGFDAGVEYILKIGDDTKANFAFSVIDIGDTKFLHEEGPSKPPSQLMNATLATAFVQDLGFIDYKFALDIQAMNQNLEFGQMLHLGMELGLPIIKLLAGWNAGYISYGASFEFWGIEFLGGLYGVEIGNGYRVKEAPRAIIYFKFLDFSFDA